MRSRLSHLAARVSARRAAAAIAAVALTFAGVAVHLPTAASASASTSDPNAWKSWTSTEGGSAAEQSYSVNEAVAIAKRFDLILGLKTTFRASDLTPQMKAANPALTMIAYSNGTNAAAAEAAGAPESWFSHAPNGARVTNTGFGNYVMNPRSAGWQAHVTSECVDFMARMGADGCYLDDMGVGNLATNFSAVPVDPNTGVQYTEAGWMDAASREAAAVRAALPSSKRLFANGLNSGSRYFGAAQSWRLSAAADGAEAEGFVRGQSQALTTFRKETQWKQDVDMLVDAELRGKAVLAKTKIWVPASASAINRWHRYALATFLLGTGGRSHFAFNADGPGKPEPARTLDSLDLGHPLEAYAKIGGLYKRAWSEGTVYVNPTTVAATVNLGGDFTDLDGATVRTLTLAPNTANVVTPVDGSTTTSTSTTTSSSTTTTSSSTTTTTTPPSTTSTKCMGLKATIVGTKGPDTIIGTPGRDVIAGLAGDDTIYGLGGDDVICGNAGADTIDAGDGNDMVTGGAQADVISGGNGDDDLRGWASNDWLDGGGGVNKLNGGAAMDVCIGGPLDKFTNCDGGSSST